MKKIALLLTLAVILSGVVLLATSCGGGISGKYTSELLGATVEFKSGGKVVCTCETLEVDGININTVTISSKGTYKIENGKIVFEMDNDKCIINGENSFEQGKDYVKIDGVTFTKTK